MLISDADALYTPLNHGVGGSRHRRLLWFRHFFCDLRSMGCDATPPRRERPFLLSREWNDWLLLKLRLSGKVIRGFSKLLKPRHIPTLDCIYRSRNYKLNDVIFHFPFINDKTINILPVAVRRGYREDEATKCGWNLFNFRPHTACWKLRYWDVLNTRLVVVDQFSYTENESANDAFEKKSVVSICVGIYNNSPPWRHLKITIFRVCTFWGWKGRKRT